MTVFLDIIFSWFVKASMITLMLGLTVSMNDALFQSTQEATTEAAVAVVADVITQDLNLAGYHVTPGHSFSLAASTEMWFLGDLNNQGSPETVHYYTSQDLSTGLYSLYRSVNREDNGRPLLVGNNFTSVVFTYYDHKGATTSIPSNISSVRVKLVANVEGVTQGFTTAMLDFRITPANL